MKPSRWGGGNMSLGELEEEQKRKKEEKKKIDEYYRLNRKRRENLKVGQCRDCKYYMYKWCYRFPRPEIPTEDHFCGEWSPYLEKKK